MIGQRFGRLIILAESAPLSFGSKKTKAWLCRCDCGRARIVAGVELRRGRITTCRKRGRINIRSAEHQSYNAMLTRCYYVKSKDYDAYGGRGITVCERWRNGEGCESGFECFLADMGRRPDGRTLDRIDNDGNYELGNCRWATSKEQALNKRSTQMLCINGEHIPLVSASIAVGIDPNIVRERVKRYGMSAEEALTRPIRMSRPFPKRGMAQERR